METIAKNCLIASLPYCLIQNSMFDVGCSMLDVRFPYSCGSRYSDAKKLSLRSFRSLRLNKEAAAYGREVFKVSRNFIRLVFPYAVPIQVTPPVAPPVTPPVAPPVLVLARLLENAVALGNAEIRQHLGLKDRTHIREHYLAPALSEGIIEATLPDKPNSRLQKYRLTDKGRALLNQEAGHAGERAHAPTLEL